MGRIIEVERSIFFHYENGKRVPSDESEFIVKNDWHCGYMAYDDICGIGDEEELDVTYGSIFQRMPTGPCASFHNGEYVESCKHCKGIYNMKDMHVVDIKGDMFVCFCDNEYSPSHEDFKKYLVEVDKVKDNWKE